MGAVAGKQLEAVKCHLCDSFSSKRLTTFERHLVDMHGTTSQREWDSLNGGPVLCACGCGRPTTWSGWKVGYGQVIIGHNGNLTALYGKEKAKEISDKRRQKLIGREGWSKGLTKATDDRVAARARATSVGRKAAFDAGEITAWSKGLTKATDDRLSVFSERQRQRFATGELTPWAKGQTKDTDPRIKEMAAKVALTHAQSNLRQRLDEIKRLKTDEIKSRIEATGKLKVVEASLQGYINDNTASIVVECSTCGSRSQSTLRRLQHGRCHTCDPGGSKAQHDVANWIRTLGVDLDTNRRDLIDGLELDMYVPSRRLGIEYNGLYWHSLLHKSVAYHQNKTDRCAAADITLFHIFEDEWRDKRNVIESMIKHRLGISSTRIGARRCEVVGLDSRTRKAFFDANHIDGDTNATVAFGLKADNEIVAAISLRRPFHRSHRQSLEVARFCCRLDSIVPGGLGRLTAVAKRFAVSEGCSSLLTYVDTRLGTREGWAASGWTHVAVTPPRFWWTDFTDRYNRFKFKADRANGLTEAQVAEAANVFKIYGCKNLTYEISLSPSSPAP